MAETISVGSLCTGYGGLDMAVARIFGAELAWYSEIEPGPIRLLQHHHPNTRNIGDLTQVDWSEIQRPSILTAGYPCQPFSIAGKKRGKNDERHIWPFIAQGVRVLRPRIVVLENVANHVRIGLRDVLGDLAALGYDAAWGVYRASDAGAPHRRERVFIVAADAAYVGHERSGEARNGWNGLADRGIASANADSTGQPLGASVGSDLRSQLQTAERVSNEVDWKQYTEAIRHWESCLGRAAPAPSATGPRGGKKLNPAFTEWMMGLPAGWVSDVPGLSMNEAIKLCGNGVVPQQAEMAIRHLWQLLND